MLKVNKRFRTILVLVVCVLVLAPVLTLAGIMESKHNLSVSGPGSAKALTETQICIFCHTPHNSSPYSPLWNHAQSVATYVNYWSTTLKSYASQGAAPPIDGFSKLCLGCHDGTVGLGAVVSRKGDIRMAIVPGAVDASGKLLPGAAGYLGTDLSGGHPLSIRYDAALVAKRNSDHALMPLHWPITDPDVRLYPAQGGYGVQCTSCHEPHGSKGGPTAPPLWQKATYEEVCQVCHDME